jgi:hypothetical protein
MHTMTKSAISLAKIQEEAPGLVHLAQAAAVSLEKKGLGGHRAAVYLVLDHSRSMDHHYHSGAVQKLADQALGLSVNMDDDGSVPVVFFSTGPSDPSDVSLSNYAGRVQAQHEKQRWGGTQYAPAMQKVINHYHSSGAVHPALVIFQTDGNPQDRPQAESLLKSASKLPMFWSFVGFGDELTFLRKLDDLRVGFGGRKVDNASLFETGHSPLEVSDAELYDGIMHEYPEWLTAARAAGILR